MEKWNVWMNQLRANGHVDEHPGRPLEGTGMVVRGKNKLVTAGPFAEVKDIVGGYMSIEAIGFCTGSGAGIFAPQFSRPEIQVAFS